VARALIGLLGDRGRHLLEVTMDAPGSEPSQLGVACQHERTPAKSIERGRLIDLLSDRDAENVTAWLAVHSGIELITRDRWSDYAQAATESALGPVRGRITDTC
jgi:hypothetical protein